MNVQLLAVPVSAPHAAPTADMMLNDSLLNCQPRHRLHCVLEQLFRAVSMSTQRLLSAA